MTGPHPTANCGPLRMELPTGTMCPTCGVTAGEEPTSETLDDIRRIWPTYPQGFWPERKPAVSVPTPKAIADFADMLGTDCHTTPAVEHRGGHRWRITVTSPRVRMWVDYNVLTRGRLKWAQSQLFIDDVHVDRADSYEKFVRLFLDPDNGAAAVAAPLPLREVDLATAPERLRSDHRQLMPALAKLATAGQRFTVTVRKGGRKWQLVAESDSVQLMFNYHTEGIDPGRPHRVPRTRPARDPFALTVDGVDRTAELDGRLEKIFGVLAAHTAAAPPPSVPGERAAAVNTSVDVRKQTVIRN